MIRIAKTEDLPVIFNLYVEMEKEFPFCKPDWDVFENTWTKHFPKDTSVIFFNSDEHGKISGFIAGFVYCHIGSKTLLAMEGIWYVVPEKRKSGIGNDLLSHFEKWSRGLGAKFVILAHPFRRIKLSGKMHGYNSIETIYMKDL